MCVKLSESKPSCLTTVFGVSKTILHVESVEFEVTIRAIPPPDVEVMLECIKARKEEDKQIWRSNDFKNDWTEIEII